MDTWYYNKVIDASIYRQWSHHCYMHHGDVTEILCRDNLLMHATTMTDTNANGKFCNCGDVTDFQIIDNSTLLFQIGNKGNIIVPRETTRQRISNAERVSKWWLHHAKELRRIWRNCCWNSRWFAVLLNVAYRGNLKKPLSGTPFTKMDELYSQHG